MFQPADIEGGKTIAMLRNVCHNQTITINGKLTKLYGKKGCLQQFKEARRSSHREKCNNQGCFFWEFFVDQAQEPQSNEFGNFIFRDDKFGRYVSGACYGSTLEEVADITDAVDPSVDEQDLATKEAVVKVIGVSSMLKYHSYIGCKKKLEDLDESKKGITCPSCSLVQKASAVSKQWLVKFLVEDKEKCNSFHLTAFHAVVCELMSYFGLNDNQSIDNLKFALLDLDDIKAIYGPRNNTILELNSDLFA